MSYRILLAAAKLPAQATAAGDGSDPQLSLPPTGLTLRSLQGLRGRGRDAKGDSNQIKMAMQCTCLVMNESI